MCKHSQTQDSRSADPNSIFKQRHEFFRGAVLIVPEDDADLERLLLSRSQMLQDVLRERREEIKRGETITLEEAFSE
jgi:hypothetical protein